METGQDALTISGPLQISSAQLNAVELTDSTQKFTAKAYERVLPQSEVHCIERTSQKLRSLDKIIHIWVRDARAFRHGIESAIPYFSLRIADSILVWELRSLVQEHFTALSTYRKEVDGPLTLCFNDQILNDKESFLAYLQSSTTLEHANLTNSKSHQQLSWPKPFAGILWVVPWRPARKQPSGYENMSYSGKSGQN
ncbi:uncharacterized protein PHALS_05312 [Plasmopara halstedii]|uniref:Uncharacterized protein n=1 Tax=Plasmopara halstedii TaxID=4781 RepID=A0A0N7L430_PLAHL|nr:uncharacterized protein PHALS_05312 [Plasmopara halstedii]CEG37531.1 hypothetical protein PHALS_05312 [Plasmopara halstedii]|eukprot:XP_024573900.1 hypothetical protein PHALS_05312 [Plasmopara halstedii]